jgi:hypothetical protein
MLIRLLPQQIVKFWDMVRFAIAETFMPRKSCTNEHLQWILSRLLASKMELWMAFTKDKKFLGFVTTRIGTEQGNGEKVLYIESAYAYQGVPEDMLFAGIKTLESYAKKNNCKTLVAMTESDRVCKLTAKLGFANRYYLFKEVTDG